MTVQSGQDRLPLLSEFVDRPYPAGVRAFITARNPQMPPEVVDQKVLHIKVRVDQILKNAEAKGVDLFTVYDLPPDSVDRAASIRWAIESMFIYELGL